MSQLALLWERLSEYRIRSIADYAEALVADAVGGKRVESAIEKGHDVRSDQYGRIEVKCRQLPADGRIEQRVELSDAKKEGFDYLAIVIFYPDFHVKAAALLPYTDVWKFIVESKYNRINFSTVFAHDNVIDITDRVAEAAETV